MTDRVCCPVCRHDQSTVDETRGERRRRRCKRCGYPFTTYELTETEVDRLREIEAKAKDLAAAVDGRGESAPRGVGYDSGKKADH